MQTQKIDKLIEEAKAKIKKIKEKEPPVLNEKIEGDNAVEEIKKDKDHVEHPLEESLLDKLTKVNSKNSKYYSKPYTPPAEKYAKGIQPSSKKASEFVKRVNNSAQK